MTLVSVIIPTFNRYDSLKLAIQSVLNQTYKNVEIIVVNDCSTDIHYYYNELETFPKTTVIHLPQNMREKHKALAAQGKTREEGLRHTKGDWICFLDDDDYMYPYKIETQLEALKANPEIQMCSSNMHVGYGSYTQTIPRRLYFTSDLPQFFDTCFLQKCNYVNNSTVMISRTLCEKVGEFKTGNFEDWDYWLRALDYTKCLYIQEPLIYYDLGHSKQYVYTP